MAEVVLAVLFCVSAFMGKRVRLRSPRSSVGCERSGRPIVTTDQPASSLEEARERLYWKIQGARSHMAMVREADEAFAEYDSHIKAAARAEVIREVEEAVVVLGESGVLDIYQRSRISIRLRAL